MNGDNSWQDVQNYGARSALDHPPRLLDQRGVRWTFEEERALVWLRAGVPYREISDEIPSRKERVAFAMARTRRRALPRLLRPVTGMAVLIGFGAVASAAIWRWPDFVAQAYNSLGFNDQKATTPKPRPPGEHQPHRSPPRTPETSRPPVVAGGATSTSPSTSTQDREPATGGASRRDLGGRPAAAARRFAAVSANEDTAPVLAAMRALRRDHDPARARALLATYLDRYPNGALAEEVLAMSIEAAVAHRDPDAASLARRYLQLYPAGPFQGLAHRTLGGPTAR